MPDSIEETTTEETEPKTVTGEIDQAFEGMAAEEVAAQETIDQKTTEGTTNEQQSTEETGKVSGGIEGVSEEAGGERESASEGVDKGVGAAADQDKGVGRSEASGETLGLSQLSNDLLLRAAGVGISLADARTFSSDVALERFLTPLEAIQAETARDDETTEQVEDLLADLPKLDPDVHDAAAIERDARLMDVIKQEREVNRDMAERLRTVEDRQQETLRASEEANAIEKNQWFDKQISELGKDFAEALGAGKTTSLQQESSQWAKREQIANLTSVLASGYQAERLESPPLDELFQTAARTVLRNEYQQLHEGKLSGELGNRATQHIERVGGRKAAASQTPEEYAVAELEKLGIPA